jgi:hypothetical protein
MMAELLAAPPSPFMSVSCTDDVVTVCVKRWKAEAKDTEEEDAGDEDEDEQQEQGVVKDLYVDLHEDWAQAVRHIRPLRVEMLLEGCVHRFTLSRSDWSPVSVDDDPSSLVVEGPMVFRATWTPNCPSKLLHLSNHGVEWQDDEGRRHRDGDRPAHIQCVSGKITTTYYTHGAFSARPSGLPNREVYVGKDPWYSVYLTPAGKIGRPEEAGPALVEHRAKVAVYYNMAGNLHRTTGPAIEPFSDTDTDTGTDTRGICLDTFLSLRYSLPASAMACRFVGGCRCGSMHVAKAWIQDGQFTNETSVLCRNGVQMLHKRQDDTTWTTTWTREGKRQVVWSDCSGCVKERVIEDACTNEVVAWVHYLSGQLHDPNPTTPAVFTTRGSAFYRDGILHRDGNLPAVVLADDATHRYYYRNGVAYDPEDASVPDPTPTDGLTYVTSLNLLKVHGSTDGVSFSDGPGTRTPPPPLADFLSFCRDLFCFGAMWL